MNFFEFNKVIKHLKAHYTCPSCNRRYRSQDIKVIETFLDKSVLQINCPQCQNGFFVVTSIARPRLHRAIKPFKKKITENEFLDLKNFLKNYQGDIKSLFKK